MEMGGGRKKKTRASKRKKINGLGREGSNGSRRERDINKQFTASVFDDV